MRTWALAAGVAAASVLVVGLAALFGSAPCASLTLETAEGATGAATLDEARVRRDAPQLSALLDRAVDEGRATETRERPARAMHAYLAEATGRADVVAWRGTPLRVLLQDC